MRFFFFSFPCTCKYKNLIKLNLKQYGLPFKILNPIDALILKLHCESILVVNKIPYISFVVFAANVPECDTHTHSFGNYKIFYFYFYF